MKPTELTPTEENAIGATCGSPNTTFNKDVSIEPAQVTKPTQSFAEITRTTTKELKVTNIAPKFRRVKPIISTRVHSSKPGPSTEPRDGSAKRLRASPLEHDLENPPRRNPPYSCQITQFDKCHLTINFVLALSILMESNQNYNSL